MKMVVKTAQMLCDSRKKECTDFTLPAPSQICVSLRKKRNSTATANGGQSLNKQPHKSHLGEEGKNCLYALKNMHKRLVHLPLANKNEIRTARWGSTFKVNESEKVCTQPI